MSNVESFKEFVKKNPRLIKFVNDGSMTWQKFYEIFDLYGVEESAWKDYLSSDEAVKATTAAASSLSMGELFSWIKNFDLDSIQNGVSSLQRVLGVIQDFSSKDATTNTKNEYKPRPLYRHFED